MPLVAERVEGVRRFRLSSKRAATQKQADTPSLFSEIRETKDNYIAVPELSSERRQYIPMGFLSPSIIVSNRLFMIPNADLFHFGVLESLVHMAWTRVTCGRFEMRYTYSAQIVYNNFVWCARSPLIERSAQAILDARARYPSRTLASLYNPESMPDDLRDAHDENDRAVLSAYGFDESMSELEMVTALMEMNARLTEG